ncbi:MAG TPA: glycosyltransferase, partial [Candidatus Babeliaceae bacterium]|nr:glycosyltransferase [Candidatus Babeliaceae bacterium]
MRILINDFGGYPFPVQLSRQLASEGHYILHVYIKNIKTPHGNMEATGPNLEIVPIILKSEFKKYSALGRLKGEHEYAGKVKYIIDSFKPDIFLSANTPLFAQRVLLHKCRKSNIKFIYWCQDIHSIAIKSVFQKKMLVAGKLLGNFFKNIERKLLKQSDHIITISDDFDDILLSWGISGEKISVIHNWGPIDEIILLPKSNNWSRRLGLGSKFVILYSGTLGLKHNPMLIAEAAKKIVKDERILFLVISEGIGAEILQRQIHDMRLTNLMVLPYQDYKDLSMVLGSADILLSI